jgi:hypothetical protein
LPPGIPLRNFENEEFQPRIGRNAFGSSFSVLDEAARDHATRGARADDDVVVTPGEHLAAPNLTMMLYHS